MQKRSPDLAQKLVAALARRGPDYHPRTQHLLANGKPEFINRLILEDSPYLLQHAHNPVDWFPWGTEAFDKARGENKPVFLSIGYATCHWCHVMEKESFENLEIARFLNAHFVSVKVDRERRPDVDATYMAAVMLMRGNGGWPMSTILTAQGKPFFGGTYFPPDQFLALLKKVAAAWVDQRAQLTAFADQLSDGVREMTAARVAVEAVGQPAIEAAQAQILQRWAASDQAPTGPRFPNEPELLFLLARAQRGGHADLLDAARRRLDQMMRGGIYDQIGGGFHRYATDGQWRIPHFEKMLYNQAHLARAYGVAYQLTGEWLYARIARQTLDYELREMAAPKGGFYSASDADSRDGEGTFFVWTPAQLEAGLGSEEAQWLAPLLGIQSPGNFEGRSIPYLPRDLRELAKPEALPALLKRLDTDRAKLLTLRDTRNQPAQDRKIVTAWNGMLITTLARLAKPLHRPQYVDVAFNTAEFLWQHNQHSNGKLWRVTPELQDPLAATQDDYAYLAQACLALYDVSSDPKWLDRARALTRNMIDLFWDTEHGGFFMGQAHGTSIARPKESNDTATPSGNAVDLDVLARLHNRTGKVEYADQARKTLNAFSGDIQRSPGAFATMLKGADDLMNRESGPLQYAGKGVVRIEAERSDKQVAVVLTIRSGWHIQAHEVSAEEFIATEMRLASDVNGWTMTDVHYPEGESVQLGFNDEPLKVYQGKIHLQGDLRATAGAANTDVTVQVRVQACNDRICLLPENLDLRLAKGY